MGRSLVAVGASLALASLAAVGSARAGQPLDGAGAAQAVQQALLAQPGGAERVLSLQDDPNVQSLLEDDAVLDAVRSGDLGALLGDARVQDLMAHPTVRGLAGDLQR
jgi:hypothetical protein